MKIFVFFLLLFGSFSLPANASLLSGTSTNKNNIATTKFSDCNWLVQYRGHTYDLTPLTKETLERPLDNDIRTVMNRYPEVKTHLDLVSKHTHDAKTHTFIATSALLGFVATRLFKSHAKTSDGKLAINIIDATFIGFFLKGVDESWNATNESKEELGEAVSTFNEVSPYKIEPAGSGATP